MEVDEEQPFVDSFTARPYQRKFLDICKEKNTIVYLPTGSGKTYIASLVIQHFAKDLVKKPFGEGGKRSVFVVNTVVLAKQQAKYFNDTTPLITKHYTGDLNVDAWKREKWREEFQEAQLIVATCQIIVDVIQHGYLSIDDLNVLVFDECHHGRGDHPMHQLMQLFECIPKARQPRVVGLSGMLLSGGVLPQNVEDELATLENIFMATIATAHNLQDYREIQQFSTNPVEKIARFLSSPKTPILQKVEAVIEECKRCIANYKLPRDTVTSSKTLKPTSPTDVKKLIKHLNDFVYQSQDMGVYGASISILSVLIDFEIFRLSAPHSAMKNSIRYCITMTEKIRHYLADEMADVENEGEKVKFFASNKLRNLIALLEEISDGMEDPANKLKALVFVKRRYTSKCLYHIIKRYAESTADCHLRPDFIVGINNRIPESIECILQTKNNKKVLDKFKKNETNVICASSVLEEGIDLQMCNVVVAYDAPETFTSYSQTKGRARVRDSQYYMMVNDYEKDKFLAKLRTYRQVESKLQECLVGKTIDRQNPLNEDVMAELFDHDIKPFRTESGAILTGLSSLNLLNRYAMSMPNDKFTNSSITWEQRAGPATAAGRPTLYISLQLPIQSKVKDFVVSDKCESIKAGKRSAAFKACKALYFAGEFSENFLPISTDNLVKLVKPIYFKLWEKYPKDIGKLAGTKKNKRTHEIAHPSQISNCHPKASETSYLYIIRIEAKFKPTDENQTVFKELLSNQNNFAILTAKKLPKLAKMSFFVSLGKVEVEIVNQPIEMKLHEEQELVLLRNFHNMVFRDILGIWKDFFCSTADSYLIVPTKQSADIDWAMVQNFQNLQPPRERNEIERKKMKFDKPGDYLHKVVNPWYRLEQEKQYVVTKVLTHITPFSSFPNDSYETYADYYWDKYQKRIVVQEQFLIEVKGISTYLNLLSPGEGEAGRAKKYNEWMNTEIYIPELCHNYTFPADLWLKATILPSILHRFHYLLVAENLRVLFAKYIGIGNENVEPEPLETEKYVINKMFKKNDSKTSFYINSYQAAMGDDSDDSDGCYRKQNRSIVYPNPEETTAKRIDPVLKSLCDGVQIMWNADEEPIDLERKWDNVYPIEIQHYVQFLTKEFEDFSIVDKADSRITCKGNGSARYQQAPRDAICDDPDKYEIKLLFKDSKNSLYSNFNVQQKDVLKAITTAGTDVIDMERYEVLGDAFLKFIVSFYLIQEHQDWHEGFLTSVKGQIVSNRNLFYCAAEFGLPGMIKLLKFAPKDDWVPPNLGVPQKVQKLLKTEKKSAHLLFKLKLTEQEQRQKNIAADTFAKFEGYAMKQPNEHSESQMQIFLNEQNVADKTVADCMESLLGVCVDSVGIKKAAKFLSFFKILPNKMDLSRILDRKLTSKRLRADCDDSEIDDLLINYALLERNLGYTFTDRAYLLQALTHASFPTNRITGCYQQLEFLGDAVLDFLISAYIFERCPEMDPGQLTDLRSSLVNNVTLACVCVRNRFHLHILAQNALLAETISKFCKFQENNKHKITDQVDLLINEEDVSGVKMADYVDVPKVLGDVFESLIGAIFLDSGNDLLTCWKVICRLLKNELNEFMRNVPIQLVRRLFEFTGANPKFDDPVIDDDLVMVRLRFSCRNQILTVEGFGQNKSDAQKAAAKIALQHLQAV